MDNILFGLKLATDDVKTMVYEKQKAEGISNEAMCIILKELVGELESKVSADYARAIWSIVQPQTEATQEGGSQNGNTEEVTASVNE